MIVIVPPHRVHGGRVEIWIREEARILRRGQVVRPKLDATAMGAIAPMGKRRSETAGTTVRRGAFRAQFFLTLP
ncbi:hypothetical protein GCM10009087_03530 [Sphingomonas oligophenolica]